MPPRRTLPSKHAAAGPATVALSDETPLRVTKNRPEPHGCTPPLKLSAERELGFAPARRLFAPTLWLVTMDLAFPRFHTVASGSGSG